MKTFFLTIAILLTAAAPAAAACRTSLVSTPEGQRMCITCCTASGSCTVTCT